MRRLTCNNGDTFDWWTVVDSTPITKSGHTYVKVKCKCGKEELKCLSDLTNGRTTKCRNCVAQSRGKILKIGDKFKGWTIISGPRIYHNTQQWLAQCECGNTRWFQSSELLNENKCFKCRNCMITTRIATFISNKGAVGELTIGKYNKLKKSAESRNISFTVTVEFLWNLYIKQNGICAITGDEIQSIKKASLDRIDSKKGYEEGNVQWVTYQANVSKHIMSMNQLYEFCKKVLNHANQQPSTPLTKCEGSTTNG